MKIKSEEIFIVSNKFKNNDLKVRKEDFNKKYEIYINFCEHKTWSSRFYMLYSEYIH